MALQIESGISHLDHGLNKNHYEWLLKEFADKDGFFIATVEIPSHLSPVRCGLHGPSMGDEPVTETEVFYAPRGSRKNYSRLCERAPRPTRKLTIIAGPHEQDGKTWECLLYTSFGGPSAPKEPTDESIASADELRESEKFWKQHALSHR